MNNKTLVDFLLQLPQTRALSTDEAYWTKTVAAVLPLVLDEIYTAHDWDFTLNEYTLNTVANQPDYNIEGEDNDCRDVINIRYGDDRLHLTYYPILEMDEIISNSQLSTDVVAWTQAGRSDQGYPIITLHSTPTTAGETLRVRYRMRDVPLSALSDDFAYVVAAGIAAWILPVLRPLFDRQLKRAIRRYRRGGRDLNRTAISPQSAKANNDIAELYGTG